MRFLRQVNNFPIFSTLLVIINGIVFCVGFFTGDALQYLGGVEKAAILEQHQYERLVWAMFLHSDAAHLFNNMIILFFLGSILENKVGHIWFLLVYSLSGIGGNIASLVYKVIENSDSLSIGASGAVFGLDGLLLALVIFSLDFRNEVPPLRVMLMIALSLYEGFQAENIDNAAHVGGLVIGFLIGLICVLFQKVILHRKYREVQI